MKTAVGFSITQCSNFTIYTVKILDGKNYEKERGRIYTENCPNAYCCVRIVIALDMHCRKVARIAAAELRGANVP